MKFLLLLVLLLVPSFAFSAQKVWLDPVRPALLEVPDRYDAKNKYPLVLALHGYGSDAGMMKLHLGLGKVVNRYGYLLLLPNGVKNSKKERYWNATPECCDFENSRVDDSAYLIGLVRETQKLYNVDPERIFIIGFSNGGFMAYRLACDTDGLFKGIAVFAGQMFGDPGLCKATTPIKVLHVHGTKDEDVAYLRDPNGPGYPGALESVGYWAERNRCRTRTERAKARDLRLLKWGLNVAPKHWLLRGDFADFLTLDFGPDTDETLFSDCDDGAKAALWTMKGASHVPMFFGRNVVRDVLGFLGTP